MMPIDKVTYPWAPSVDDVAAVLPNYTVGGFDDDNAEPGLEGTFDDTTSPTATEVEGFINAACQEVAGRVGVPIPAAQYGLATTTAKWHAAATVAGNKVPAGTDDAGGEYRSKILNYRNSLDALIQLARMPIAMRLR